MTKLELDRKIKGKQAKFAHKVIKNYQGLIDDNAMTFDISLIHSYLIVLCISLEKKVLNPQCSIYTNTLFVCKLMYIICVFRNFIKYPGKYL